MLDRHDDRRSFSLRPWERLGSASDNHRRPVGTREDEEKRPASPQAGNARCVFTHTAPRHPMTASPSLRQTFGSKSRFLHLRKFMETSLQRLPMCLCAAYSTLEVGMNSSSVAMAVRSAKGRLEYADPALECAIPRARLQVEPLDPRLTLSLPRLRTSVRLLLLASALQASRPVAAQKRKTQFWGFLSPLAIKAAAGHPAGRIDMRGMAEKPILAPKAKILQVRNQARGTGSTAVQDLVH